MTSFEERLLAQLRAIVAEAPAARSRKRPKSLPPGRLALAGGVAGVLAVAATAAVLLLPAGATAAYAVTRNTDGTVTVEINSLRDAAGLQAKLREAGVNAIVEYLPAGKACKQGWVTPAPRMAAGGPIQGGVLRTADGHVRFTISDDLPAEVTLVITTQTGPDGASGPGAEAISIALAQGEVEPCQVVDAPPGSAPFGPPPDGARLQSADG
jgi:hypothetical protein